MPFVNLATREINCKVVYYGPGLSGKTTNIKWIYNHVRKENRGDLISLSTDTERTLYFDFFFVEVANIKGFKVRFYLYTTPGHIIYKASRKPILKGVDGIVFVADSHPERKGANVDSFEDLLKNLYELKIQPKEIPFVFQYNKRDLVNALPIKILRSDLNVRNSSEFEAVAVKGIGVMETFQEIAKLVISNFNKLSS